jgi:superfamily II DNA or RNA helicase
MSQLTLFQPEAFAVAKPLELPCGIVPRDYQRLALERTQAAFEKGSKGALIRLPTGTGKTVVGSMVAHWWLNRGEEYRVIVCSHEQQLIWQFAQEIEEFLQIPVGIEMGDERVSGLGAHQPRVVVASRQTLCQLKRQPDGSEVQKGRIWKFDPLRYKWLLIIDESHRWAFKLKSCAPILQHFEKGADNRRLGLTATPKRTDGVSLAHVTPEVAIDYRLFDVNGGPCAVRDGWAVAYDQRYIQVEGVDFKKLKEVKGDFDQDQLAAELTTTEALASLCKPLLDLAGDKRTIIFNATVAMAKDVAGYLNATVGGTVARSLDGSSPPEVRQRHYGEHQRGVFQYLSVCGLCREGYNDPGIGVVAVFRPTKSQPLAEQMKGRGCRPLRGIVDGLVSPEERRAAIAASTKPKCVIVDLVGVTGLADCASTAHILGAGKPDEVIERANKAALKKAKADPSAPIDIAEELRQAEQEIEEEKAKRARADREEREKARKAREERERQDAERAQRRASLGADVRYTEHRVEQGQGGRPVKGKRGARMPYGKHQGQLITDIRTDYLEWVVKTDWPRHPWVKVAAQRELNLRSEAAQVESGSKPWVQIPAGRKLELDEVNALLRSLW